MNKSDLRPETILNSPDKKELLEAINKARARAMARLSHRDEKERLQDD